MTVSIRVRYVAFAALVGVITFVGPFRAGADEREDNLALEDRCINGAASACSRLGLSLEQEGQLAEAQKFYEKGCDGDSAYGCYGLAEFKEKAGASVDAGRLYEKACTLDPKDEGVEACLRLGKGTDLSK